MISLRAVTEQDTDFILSLINDPKIAEFFPRDGVISKQQHLSFLEKIREKGDQYWIIKKNNESIGTVSIYNIDHTNNTAEWGRFIIKPTHSAMGVAVEKLILKIAFEDLQLNKLYCQCLATNERVIKLHELLGFKIEGTLRQQIYKKGKFIDIVFMGRLKNDN
jgi:UDP-4-amino-4,6-dideoxy-N-acetyl-beta-L-altrosamine N-acetyltransferase